MNANDPRSTDNPTNEVVIAKEDAVFWMDDRGRWHNRHGRFEHKRIIDHFNRAIRRDADGYYVTQVLGGLREKVYFPFADTPLFVTDIIPGDPVGLLLNTGEEISLDPRQLFVAADRLYQGRGDERIKFGDRALVAVAPYLEEKGDGLVIRVGGHTYSVPEVKMELKAPS